MEISAFCPTHGLISIPSLFSIAAGSGSSIAFKNLGTNCPICGATSEILNGVYTKTLQGRVNCLLQPGISIEAMRAIEALARRLQSGNVTLEEARNEVSKSGPEVKSLFNKLFGDLDTWDPQARAQVMAAVIGGVTVLSAAAMTASATVIAPMAGEIAKAYMKQPIPKDTTRVSNKGNFKTNVNSTTAESMSRPIPKPIPKPKRRP
ncbi:exodeoxyribonuclease VII small subunit [Pseudovibrio sp. Ad37]|uniref:exodeoxyribonuclease VII small subunit n=1 Tax=Pseudovibrio sp. Ad37 TaxID=989422 RepID=UPI0007B18FA9|nr:exodeoxyribonuclease VII small subunit [Pseudovibrio sp. Ad37]KZL25675.1 hypothetical protein PsAD37_02230 [Pseudovibrio sp. Ad37]